MDISDRVRAEAELRASEDRFSQVFHASPMGIAISTVDEGRLVDVNERYLRIVGFRRDQLEGKDATALNVWPTLDDRREAVEALLATRSYRSWRKQFRHASGELRTAFVSMRLLDLQGERRILTMLQDVTDREDMEEELGRQRQFLEVLLEHLHETVVACDETGTITVSNRASRDLYGRIETGRPLEDWAAYPLYHADGRTRMRTEDLPLHRALHGEAVRNVEATVVPEAGEPRLLQVNAQPLFSDRGEKLGAVAVTHDVTEWKAYEQELERSAAFRESLVRITNEFLEEGPSDRSYANLLDQGVRAVPGAQGGSVLVRGTDGAFRFAAVHGYDLEALSTVRLAEHELIKPPEGARVAVARHFAEHNREVLDAERSETLAAGGRSSEIHASLTVPVSASGELAAVLHLDNFEREDAFDEEAISMAEAVAAQLGVLAQRFSLERELEERESRLAEAQRIAKLGSWQWDIGSDTMIRSENQSALFGLTKDAFPPNIEGFLQRVHPRDRQHVVAAMQRAQQSPGAFTFEYRTVTPAGDERIHLVRGEVETDAEGRPQHVLGTTQDVTEQKRATQDAQRNAEALQRRNQEMHALNQMVEVLQACRNPEEAYDAVHWFGPKLLRTRAGALYLRDRDAPGESRPHIGNRAQIPDQARHGSTPASPPSTSTTMLRTISWGDPSSHETLTNEDCWAMRRNQTHIVDHPDGGLLCRHISEPVAAAYLCTPLTAQGRALGMLHLEGEAIDEHEIELTRTFADQLALALANVELREELREQSIRDPLTGLFNRRYLGETLERELGRAGRGGAPVALILLDVDRFKPFNDDYGHDAGDLVLQRVSEVLQARTRTEDVPCRYGGEEFALLMPGADLDIAMLRADEIRREAKEIRVEHHGRTLPAVTLSLGVAAFPHHGPSGSDLLRAADRALYHAKTEGRDRVEAAEDADASP